MKHLPRVGIIPLPPERRWRGIVVSVALHAVLLAVLLGPAASGGVDTDYAVGGGGAGPRGGGGASVGAQRERVAFIRTAAPEPNPAAAVVSSIPVPPPVLPAEQRKPPPSVPLLSAGVAGSPTGPGGTGGSGAGSGIGGGVGSGVGTGQGSAEGPGTGGGPGKEYPPSLTRFFLPPLPAPERVKPYHLIAWFEVDEKGTGRLLTFNPSKDAAYNKRLREVLLALKFRPAVRADGTPFKDTVDVQFIF